jgi:hypothetical protein
MPKPGRLPYIKLTAVKSSNYTIKIVSDVSEVRKQTPQFPLLVTKPSH